jgi:uncharacterized HAD superfamily protein
MDVPREVERPGRNGLNGEIMRIGIDIDGVIVDFVSAFLRIVGEEYGINLSREDVFCFNLAEVLGLPEEEVRRLIDKTMVRNEFALIPGARRALQKMEGWERILVTGRDAKYQDVTRTMLERLEIPFERLIHASFLEKHLYDNSFHLFIEDNVEEALRLSEEGIPVLVFRQPWNRSTHNLGGYFRPVQNWEEVLEVIEEIEKTEGHSSE